MVLKLLVDFGLVVLIWMVQLVVYPGLTYYSESDLISWHSEYTAAISIIVMPLMVAQAGIHGRQLFSDFSRMGVAATVLIGSAWVNTFFFAVPLHHQIAARQNALEAAQELVSVNWYRTVLWSVVFLLSVRDYLRNSG